MEKELVGMKKELFDMERICSYEGGDGKEEFVNDTGYRLSMSWNCDPSVYLRDVNINVNV